MKLLFFMVLVCSLMISFKIHLVYGTEDNIFDRSKKVLKKDCPPKWKRSLKSFVGNIKWRWQSINMNIGELIFGAEWRLIEEMKLKTLKKETNKAFWQIEDYWEDLRCEL